MWMQILYNLFEQKIPHFDASSISCIFWLKDRIFLFSKVFLSIKIKNMHIIKKYTIENL